VGKLNIEFHEPLGGANKPGPDAKQEFIRLHCCITMTRATPIYFPLGSSSRSTPGAKGEPSALFGWLHEPSSQSTSNIGIVICDAVAHPDTRYLHRMLAEQFSFHGFCTLRFDYYGTGDSSGNDEIPGLLESWIDSINAAVDALAARYPSLRICLVGLRLGGTLATLATARRTDSVVTSIVLWAPIIDGMALARQIQLAQALQFHSQRPHDDTHAKPSKLSRHFFGFSPTPLFLDDLGQLDLLRLRTKPVSRVLMLKGNEQTSYRRLVEHFDAIGVRTDSALIPSDPRAEFHPNVPRINDFVEAVTAWASKGNNLEPEASLITDADAAFRERPVDQTSMLSTSIGGTLNETAFTIATPTLLFGILSEPSHQNQREPQLCIILLNSNRGQHIGPGRLHVLAAREWAARGHTVLRFDLSGVGDSSSQPEGTDDTAASSRRPVTEVREAMDAVSHLRKIHSFILCGVCSGAQLAFRVGCVDRRIVGLHLINAPTFAASPEDSDASLHTPGNQLLHLAERGVKAMFIYSNSDVGLVYFERELSSATRELCFPLRVFADADHIFSDPATVPLINALADHIQQVAKGLT
jgi:alpha-beta hydrolase superfamily lysophospholipase